MQIRDKLALLLIIPVATGVTFVTVWALDWPCGISNGLFTAVLFLSSAAIVRLGKSRNDKGAICFRTGTIVLLFALLVAFFLTKKAFGEKVPEQKEYIGLLRTYTLILGSTFGASIMARGIQYAADHDLKQKGAL